MWIRVKAPGSCGELIQGVLDGRPFLVTCPIDLYAEATVSAAGSCVGLGNKAKRALSLLFKQWDVNRYPYRVALKSNLPKGKGMASSSADIAAVCKAAAISARKPLGPRRLGAIAASIEPTDGIFHRGIVLYDHIAGKCRAYLGDAPEIKIAVFDTGGSIDTLRFNRRRDLNALREANEDKLREALALLKRGIQTGDAKLVGEAATISALANQTILYKNGLEEAIQIAKGFGAVGVNAAHSGTVIGALFPREAADGIAPAIAYFNHKAPMLKWLGTVSLISGGFQIETAPPNLKEAK